jgi:hypothetical protein
MTITASQAPANDLHLNDLDARSLQCRGDQDKAEQQLEQRRCIFSSARSHWSRSLSWCGCPMAITSRNNRQQRWPPGAASSRGPRGVRRDASDPHRRPHRSRYAPWLRRSRLPADLRQDCRAPRRRSQWSGTVALPMIFRSESLAGFSPSRRFSASASPRCPGEPTR